MKSNHWIKMEEIKKIIMFWSIYLCREHFGGSKRGQTTKVAIETFFYNMIPPDVEVALMIPPISSCLVSKLCYDRFSWISYFLKMSHSQSNSRSNCILTHYIRNCVCTNVLIILWDVQKKLRIMIQSFLEISRKVEESFCHGKNSDCVELSFEAAPLRRFSSSDCRFSCIFTS